MSSARVSAGLLAVVATAALRADIAFSLDKLDLSDGLPLPPSSVAVVDLAVTPPPNEVWVSTYFWGETRHGATIVYAQDPNGFVTMTAPGPERRFVTFFSRPRGRDALSRFTWSGYAYEAGTRKGMGPALHFPWLINSGARHPITYPPYEVGYVLRVAIDLSQVDDPRFRTDSPNIVVAFQAPPNSVPLFESICPDEGGTLLQSFQTTVGFDWGIYAVTCFGDLNGDHSVGLRDLTILLSHFGETVGARYIDGDLDADGAVGLPDLSNLLAEFGDVCVAP